MKVAPLLSIEKGITALIGGGGKTTLMETLAKELPGKVIITTTTKIMTPEHIPTLLSPTDEEIQSALRKNRVICVAAPFENGKLTAPSIEFANLVALADYVIVEADGARRLPLKAHAPHEPVIPPNTAKTVLVVGIDGIGKKIAETCHRPELYAERAGVGVDAIVTPAIVSRVIQTEGFGDCLYINKVEGEAEFQTAQEIARHFFCPVLAGSLHRGVYRTCGL